MKDEGGGDWRERIGGVGGWVSGWEFGLGLRGEGGAHIPTHLSPRLIPWEGRRDGGGVVGVRVEWEEGGGRMKGMLEERGEWLDKSEKAKGGDGVFIWLVAFWALDVLLVDLFRLCKSKHMFS